MLLLTLLKIILLIHLNFKSKMTGQSGEDGTKNVEIMVPLRYSSNFWRIYFNLF